VPTRYRVECIPMVPCSVRMAARKHNGVPFARSRDREPNEVLGGDGGDEDGEMDDAVNTPVEHAVFNVLYAVSGSKWLAVGWRRSPTNAPTQISAHCRCSQS
jgi:hypothetical protein